MSIDDQHLDAVEGVVDALRSQGLQVTQVLADLGVITGSVDDERQASLWTVPGVASVDTSIGYQLPAPDSDVQ